MTAFTYDLDRDETGNWVGRLRPRLRIGMACWSVIVIGWLLLAGLAATGLRTDFAGGSPSANVPQAGTLQVSGTRTTNTVPCNGGYLSVSGVDNTVTVTGHCTSVSVSGDGNHVTVDSTDAVSASGRGNVVTYHWGSPKVANAGTSNTVVLKWNKLFTALKHHEGEHGQIAKEEGDALVALMQAHPSDASCKQLNAYLHAEAQKVFHRDSERNTELDRRTHHGTDEGVAISW